MLVPDHEGDPSNGNPLMNKTIAQSDAGYSATNKNLSTYLMTYLFFRSQPMESPFGF
jgi:hypothetical protein